MAKIVKTLTVSWQWSGDKYSLRGFNLAVTPAAKNPKEEVVATAFVETKEIKQTYSYKMGNVTLDKDAQYKIWVQAVYENSDSDWVATGGATVSDDGSATIITKTDREIQDVVNMASDNILTRQEKISLRREWQEIVYEFLEIESTAISQGIPSSNTAFSNFKSKGNALGTYLNGGTAWTISSNNKTSFPLWINDSNLGSNTSINGNTYRETFRVYYEAKVKILEEINEYKVNNVQIGATNIIRNSSNPKTLTHWNDNAGFGIAKNELLGENVFRILATDATEKYGATNRYKVEPNCQYTFAMDVYMDANVTSLDVFWLSRAKGSASDYDSITHFIQAWKDTKSKWVRITGTFTTKATDYEGYIRIDNNGTTNSTTLNGLWFTKVKLEKGNKATDWSPALEDMENAYTIILTNEAEVIPTNSNRVPTSSTTYFTDIQVYKGTTQRNDYTIGTINSANGITVSKTSSRVNFAVSTNTALAADGGNFIIPITIDGKTFNKTFSWSCSKQGNTGASGVGISKITEYYAVSSSNTTEPTSWSTTVPAMTATNKYLWNYETITYSNNTTANTSKRVIGVYGDKGNTGATGATGNGISNIVNYYLATSSSSGVTTSTSGWTTSVQAVSASKKYLWNYEVITYTNGSTSTTTPCIIGAYGDTGATGNAGQDAITIVLSNENHTFPCESNGNIPTALSTTCVVTAYKGGTSVTPTIGTITNPTGMTITKNGATLTIQANTGTSLADSGTVNIPITVDGKTFNKTFTWSKAKKGATGATGATGAGAKTADIIASSQVFKSTDGGLTFSPTTIKLTPKLQNVTYSNWQYSTNGGSSWANVVSGEKGLSIDSSNKALTVSKDSSLFTPTVTSIAFRLNTNDSSIYDTMTIVKLYDVADLEIGGRNLISKSYISKRNTSGSFDSSTNTWNLTATAGEGGTWGCGLVLTGNKILVPYGKTYVLSFEIKVPRTCSWNADVNNYPVSSSNWNSNDNDETAKRKTSSKSLVANQWVKCWVLWSNTHSSNTNKVDLYDNSNFGIVMKDETSDMTFQIRNIKGELGMIPTDWTPAPEDVATDIDNAKNEAIDSANNTLTTTISNYYTKEQTNSQIDVAKEAINLGVSNTYETKANVETKITSTLNNAKSYADTKKNEAINTASSDATNKVNSAKNELNTAINKKANSSDVYSKAEVYTKGQTDSAIKVAKDEINLGVSNTYETKANVETKITSIQVGGTNLMLNTSYATGITGWGHWNGANSMSVVAGRTSNLKALQVILANQPGSGYRTPTIPCNKSTKYTVSFWVKSSIACKFGDLLKFRDSSGTESNPIDAQYISVPANTWTFYSFSFTSPSTSVQMYTTPRIEAAVGTPTVQITEYKLEYGTKATSWSPSPEEVSSDITTAKNEAISSANSTLSSTIANYYTKAQTDSQIKVAKDEINLGVSSTYETKANVETKVSSTLNSAKSYADTKKTEAVNAASKDATNKVNSAKNELNTAIGKKANSTDVYTKTQVYTKDETNSQINIAKDAINLGVSNTYETKTNVETKVNTTLNSAKSYADTKKNEAINSAASDATNKVNSAKNELNTKIDGIQIGGRNLLKGTSSSFKEFTMSEWNCLPYTYLLSDLGLKVGDKVAFKLYLKFGNTLCGGAARITFYDTAGTNIKSVQDTVYIKPNSEGYSEITTVIPTNAVKISVGVQREVTGSGLAHFNFQIKEPKLEQGTKCSSWTPAPEDFDKNITDVKNSLNNFQNTVNTTFKDGIVEQAEAKAIAQHLKTLDAEKADIDKEYSAIYGNSLLGGTAKTNLANAKTSFDSAHNSLKSTINTVISDGKVTSTEKASVDSTFTTYNGVLGTYKQRVQEALDAIGSAKVDNVQIGGINLLTGTKDFRNGKNTGAVHSEKYNGFTVLYKDFSTATSGYSDVCSWSNAINVKQNTEYTLSFYAKGSGNISSYFYPNNVASGYSSEGKKTDATDGFILHTLTNNWKRYWIVWKTSSATTGLKHVLPMRLMPGATGYICGVKFEEGNKATDWSPAPEDITSDIATAKNEAINSANSTLTTTIANYYTKTQTDSQINIAKEAINLGVSNTYETKAEVANKINSIQVGGRNLVINSTFNNGLWSSSNSALIKPLPDKPNSHIAEVSRTYNQDINTPIYNPTRVYREYKKGDTVTISFDFYCEDFTKYYTNGAIFTFRYSDAPSGGTINGLINAGYESFGIDKTLHGKWQRAKFVYTFDRDRSGYFIVGLYMSSVAGSSAKTVKHRYREIKLEEGNKATSWTPAPEDVDSDINKKANATDVYTKTQVYTKEETNSQIKVAKDEINLGVSNTYETKTNVESKISSANTTTLNSAKSYADTKKSEAITQAGKDADSKVNSAKKELNTAIGNAVDNVKIGGRNLMPNTNFHDGTRGWGVWNNANSMSIVSGRTSSMKALQLVLANQSGSGYKTPLISCESGKSYTVSFWFKSTIACKIGDLLKFRNANGNDSNPIDAIYISVPANTWTYYSRTFTAPSSAVSMFTTPRIESAVGTPTVQLTEYQLEEGTKATSWTPAPEDVDSAINKKANSTDVYTKTQVYTKDETNSQINVTKNAITQSVSSTYETKTNVETKINNITIGGTNLIANSNFAKNAYWSTNSSTAYDNNGYNGNRCITITRSGYTDSSRTGTSSTTNSINDVIPKGTIFTLSGWVYVHSGSGIPALDADNSSFFLRCYKVTDDALVDVINIPIPRTTEVNKWVYFSKSGTTSENFKAHPSLSFYLGKNGKISLSQVKLEYGNKATSWTPAPEDIENEITVLESETKTLKESVSSLQLNSDSINASVKSLQETVTNTTNGLASDISSIQNQVNLAMTANDVKLEIQKEMAKGTNKVTTATGFTFNESGLNISKSDSEMSTQITEDGMKVYRNNDVVLTANNQGVDAKNLHATTYLIIGGNSRMESITEDGTKRTAVFWIGN